MKHLLQNMLKKNTPIWLPLISTVSAASTIVYEPSLYFSERDSPFYGGIVDNTGDGIFLETFEDQELNTPYVRQEEDTRREGNTIRTLFPNTSDAASIGVDGDDGVIDGQARGGDAWVSTSTGGGGPSHVLSFQFERNEDGNYPLYVGLVITQPNNFFAPIEVNWRNPNNRVIYDDGYIPRDWVPPEGATLSSPLIQRFVGLYHEDGISRISMTNVNQVDHLQYGYSIPEPSTAILAGLAIGLMMGHRKRS